MIHSFTALHYKVTVYLLQNTRSFGVWKRMKMDLDEKKKNVTVIRVSLLPHVKCFDWKD